MKKALCLLSALLLAVLAPLSVLASAENGDYIIDEERVIRVAYPIQRGLTDMDEDGNLCGYTYEYLQEIAQYTGWSYEFVQTDGSTDSLMDLMEQVQSGEIDLMGAMSYTEAAAEMFNYSSYSYATSETVLQTSYSKMQEVVFNSQLPQTFKIAVTGNENSRNVKELQDYCSLNQITPEFVHCDNDAEMVKAVQEDRADMLLSTSFNYLEDMWTIAKFSPKPVYFVASKNAKADIMEDLNTAIMHIEQSDANFATRLYNKYFLPQTKDLVFSEAERQYLQETGVLKVGVLSGQPPFQQVGVDGEASGVAIDMLDYIKTHTGLEFELVYADSQNALYDLVKEKKVDLVAGMPYDYDLAQAKHLSMTQPYVSSQYILVMNDKSSNDSLKDKRPALLANSPFRGDADTEAAIYETTRECVHAVASGEADYTYIDTYSAQYYMNQPEYRNLRLISQNYGTYTVCFGVVKPGRQELLSIFNRVISTAPEEDIQNIINKNTLQKTPFSLGDLIRQNPVGSIALVGGVLLVIILILLYFLRQRAHMSKQAALELKKHLQVYALVNEYFFEYDFATDTSMVSVPPKDTQGPSQLVCIDHKKPLEDEMLRISRERFLAAVRSVQNGIQEIELYWDGDMHWVRVALETVLDGDRPIYTLGKFNIIDDEKKEKEELLEKSQLDSLTHILNAETCRSRIVEDLQLLQDGEHGAMILIDIDRFKEINDTYGHMKGDEALQSMAVLLRSTFRADDVVGRPGGDEFIVYMKNVTDTEALRAKCRTLCDRVQQLTVAGGGLTISAGGILARKGDSYNDLYVEADQALYRAKNAGRNRFQIAPRD
ncbi:diguanylate cyclase domain-containing protein [Neobittarella massiliensis]|uniref:diguanylate cyclase domain-containing protein n=1 Tax=Neobittarella massiliensis (ex Bilen et al. 2018) TaxID=2041842 RepID=UPI000CF6576B|nr:transporter substrate-binding domain-containing protein [Neobittarella massiliensis]